MLFMLLENVAATFLIENNRMFERKKNLEMFICLFSFRYEFLRLNIFLQIYETFKFSQCRIFASAVLREQVRRFRKKKKNNPARKTLNMLFKN